jgi:branched-chain amino acid transport system ATP-binding protein
VSDVVSLPLPRVELRDVAAGYGPVPVLFDVSLTLREAEIVALLGPNGAGKTTTLRTVAGLVAPVAGSVLVGGQPVGGMDPERIARLGVQLVPEGGGVLRGLTVTENLLLAGWCTGRRRAALTPGLARAFEVFPALAGRRQQLASTLSGGERQMLALAQAVMTESRILLIDEASLGLSPQMVVTLFEVVRRLRDEGRSILLVEQHAHLALDVADRAYVMEKGRIVAGGGDVETRDRLAHLYLGDPAPAGS